MSPPRSNPPIENPNTKAPRLKPPSVSSRTMISMGQREAVAARQLAPNAYDATESGVIRASAESPNVGRGGSCQVKPGTNVSRCRKPRTIGWPRFVATRKRDVGGAEIPPRRVGPAALVARDVEAGCEAAGPSRQTEPVGTPAHAIVEDITLVREGQAARVEPGIDLPHSSFGSRIADGHFRVDRGVALHAQPRGIHPDGPGILDVRRKEIRGGAVGSDLLSGGRIARRPEGQERECCESGRPAARPTGRQGNTVTVVFDTCVRGIVIA